MRSTHYSDLQHEKLYLFFLIFKRPGKHFFFWEGEQTIRRMNECLLACWKLAEILKSLHLEEKTMRSVKNKQKQKQEIFQP